MILGKICEGCGRSLPATAPAHLCWLCVARVGRASWMVVPAQSQPCLSLSQGGSITEDTGCAIGRYKLAEKLGEGGFGVVWAAEQMEPVKRRVALKIIKLGMDTRQVVARFETERQALALMDHPHIARVLDAGTTETGRPYFVMELVRGLPITQHCGEGQLSVSERLKLFIQVCHAIQHAHQKGVIHRDIKPSNVLVSLHDGIPTPKVIDFGIAKATEAELAEQTVYTECHHFIGTPAYMSPEQIERCVLDIDTRSDIYSLGVLLYELLTNATPFDTEKLVRSGWDEMRRLVREVEPLRPSGRVIRGGGMDSPLRGRPIDRDLDWIVMKCLEKDRNRRYDTANGLAMDVQRFLRHESITARPPSAAYQIQKAFRRNRLLFTSGATVVTALSVGLGLALWMFARERNALRKADEARQEELRSRELIQETLVRESAERERAEAGEAHARAQAYAADINLADQALRENHLGRVTELLNVHEPRDGDPDLRGWEWRYLWGQCQSDEIAALTGHTSRVGTAAFVSGGRLATGSDGGEIHLWDVNTRKLIERLILSSTTKHERPRQIRAMAFDSDSRRLFMGADSWLTVYDTAVGSIEADLDLHSGAIWEIAISPNGRILAVGALQLLLFDAQRLKPIPRTPLPEEVDVGGLAFSPSSELVAAADDKGRIFVSEASTGRLVIEIAQAHQRIGMSWAVRGLAFTSNGTRLISAGGDRDIKLWDVATGELSAKTRGHEALISSLSVAPVGTYFATGGADQLIKFWRTRDLLPLGVMRGNRDEITDLDFSSDGTLLATSSLDKMVRIWPATPPDSRGLQRRFFSELGQHPRFSSGGTRLRIVRDSRGPWSWDWTHPDHPRPIDLAIETTDGTLPIPVLADRAILLIKENGTAASLCENADPIEPFDGFPENLTGQWSEGFYTEFRFAQSQDLNRLFIVGMLDDAPHLLVWNHATLSIEQKIACRIAAPSTVALAPDQTGIFLGDENGNLEWIDLTEKRSVFHHQVHKGRITGIAGAKDGATAIVATFDGYLKKIRLSDQALVQEHRGALQGIQRMTASEDGRRVATANGEGVVKIWDFDHLRQLLTLNASNSLVWDVAWHPDGDTILASSYEGLYEWRAPSWREIREGRAHLNSGGPPSFHPE